MLYFIATPIGNIEDISYRAVKTLQEINYLLAEDTRVARKLLNLLKEKFDLSFDNIKKIISFHSYNEESFLKKINKEFFIQNNVAFISDAGTPGISDPGIALVRFAIENNIDYTFIPGASAAIIAIASSPFLKKEFIFAGFLPKKGRKEALKKFLSYPFPTIFFESPNRVLDFLNLVKEFDNREVFVIKEISKMHEKKFFGKASEVIEKLKENKLNGEFCIVVDSGSENGKIEINDILKLNIPINEKAKLLAKITKSSKKEWYEKLQNLNNQ